MSWVRYELQWSNPLWEAVGFDAVTEEAQILRHVLVLVEGLGPSDPAEFSDEALSAMTMRLAAHPKWGHLQCGLELLATAFWALSDWGPYPWLGLAAAALVSRWSAPGAASRTAGGVVNEMEGFEMVGGVDS